MIDVSKVWSLHFLRSLKSYGDGWCNNNMKLYRAVGLQELALIYDSGMKTFPVGLPQQPIFYPVLQVEYARQIATDWNIKSGEFAGYVTQFTVDDEYISRFEKHAVGDSPYQEIWISAEELAEFNKHIVGSIKTVEAYFGESFEGFVPENFGLKGKSAVEQFTLLANTYIYKRMEFYLEIRRNHKAVYLNFPFWQKYGFKNPGSKEKILKAIREAWLTSFPNIPLVHYVETVTPLEKPYDLPPTSESDQGDDELTSQTDPGGESEAEQEYPASTQQAEYNFQDSINAGGSHSVEQIDSDSLVEPDQTQLKQVKPTISYFARGVTFGLDGNYREAIGALSRAVEQDPDHGVAHTSLGVAFHNLGEDNRALSCYKAALQIHPKNADAHFFLANILYRQGNVREAITEYTIAVGLEPKLIDAHEGPSVHDRLTDYTSTPAGMYWIAKAAQHILDLDEMLEADPRQSGLFKERAAEYFRLLNFEQSVKDYSSSLALEPEDASTFHLRGIAYEKLGQYDQALRDYQQAVAINPRIADAYINRGIAHANAGNFRQAIDSLNEGIRFAPGNPDVYFNRGVSYFHGGDLGRAIEDFSQVIQLSPNDEEAYYWRGVSNEEAGRHQDAIADYKRFLELSQNPPAREDVEQRLRRWNREGRIDASSQRAIPWEAGKMIRNGAVEQSQDPDIYHLIVALGERAIHSIWFGTGMECYGETAEELFSFTDHSLPIRGQDLLRIGAGLNQVNAGDFAAFDPDSEVHWIFIRAWEGKGFYIEINDSKGKELLKKTFRSVEEVEGANPSYETLFIPVRPDSALGGS